MGDALTGDVVRELEGHRECVRDVSWHPYRPEITTSSWDSSLARWTYMEDIKDKESGTGDKKTADKATNSKVTKKSSNASAGASASGNSVGAEENSNSNRDESEGETTELRRSKRARNRT